MDRESSPTESDASPATLDDAFLTLRNRDRRYVCYFLLEHDRAALSEVADAVTGWIHASDDGIVEPQCRDQRAIQLRQTHVPKLVDAAVIDHDEETDTLSIDSCSEPIREFVLRACATETGSTRAAGDR